METFELKAQRRTDLGTGASRRLRRAGYVPAIMYGGEKEPLPLTLSHNDLLKQLEHEAFYSRILTVNIDNQTEKAILRDLQRHPSYPVILHLDLQRISETQKIQMRVPLHFINEENCVGVKQSGGVVSHQMTEVEIRCLPKDLPEFIEIDLQDVKLNQIIHLSDLVLPEGVEIAALTHGETTYDLPIVSIHVVRGTRVEEQADQEESTEEQQKG